MAIIGGIPHFQTYPNDHTPQLRFQLSIFGSSATAGAPPAAAANIAALRPAARTPRELVASSRAESTHPSWAWTVGKNMNWKLVSIDIWVYINTYSYNF